MIERVAAEARTAIERVATNAVIQLELGPKTRQTIETAGLTSNRSGKTREAIEGLLGKEKDEATPE